MKNKNDFYSSSAVGEISMRDEFDNTMYGTVQEVAKHQDGLLRRFRTDDAGAFVPCVCVDSVTGEPDRDSRCPICLGEGNVWDEEEIQYYRIRANTESANTSQDKLHAPGLLNTETEVFYIPSSFSLTKHDKLVVLTLDKEGVPVQPFQRFQLFRISELRPMRLDNGRLEFWKAYCYEDGSKFL